MSGEDGPASVSVSSSTSDQHSQRADSDRKLIICRSVEEVTTIVEQHGIDSKTDYCQNHHGCNYNKDWKPAGNIKTLSWSGKEIPFDGIPFVYVPEGRLSLACHQGSDQNWKQKQRFAEAKKEQQVPDHIYNRGRQLIQKSKKVGCPATIYVTEVVKFPQFKASADKEPGKVARKSVKTMIENMLSASDAKPKMENVFYVRIPQDSHHQGHPVNSDAAGLHEKVDQRVVTKIMDLTRAGIRKCSALRLMVNSFVTNELFHGIDLKDHPHPSRRRFFPTSSDIRNIMMKARSENIHAKLDQENLGFLIALWQEKDKDDNIMFRPHTSAEGAAKTMLFCYQAQWQRRLLLKYGETTLLDATYRTTRYAMPLFFLCVRTNVNYIVVGAFVVQHETTAAITEALAVFKEWNKEWSPHYFMIDFAVQEREAIKKVWPDVGIKLCDFHREKAWKEWCNKKAHGVAEADKKMVRKMLTRIAQADDEKKLKAALGELQTSPAYKGNPQLQRYLNTTWLPEIKIWCAAYFDRKLNVIIRTNNGLERQNECLKYGYLEGYKNCSLSDMITVLVTRFLPDSYLKYMEKNVRSSSAYRAYDESVPSFLVNRPRDVVRHIFPTRYLTDLELSDIDTLTPGKYEVKSEGGSGKYTVLFGDDITPPSCSCADWEWFHLPCKHMCAVFRCIKDVGWNDLSPTYINHPSFHLDETCLSNALCTDSVDTGRASDSVKYENTYEPLPLRVPTLRRQLIQKCVASLKTVTDLVYQLKDTAILEKVLESCTSLQASLATHVPKEDGLELLVTPKKEPGSDLPTQSFPELVQVTKKEVEQVDEDAGRVIRDLNKVLDDVPSMACDDPGVTPTVVGKRKQSIHHLEPLPKRKCHKSKRLHTPQSLETTSAADTQGWRKIGPFTLTAADKERIESGDWLTDTIVNAAQNLVSLDNPFLGGLVDTVLLAAGEVSAPVTVEAVQCHHIQNHWVTSSSIGNRVTVYDSMNTPLRFSLKKQLVDLYRCHATTLEGQLKVMFKISQFQRGSSDCGLFAIANMVSLASGVDPANIHYVQDKMRDHLISCFEKEEMCMFPHNVRHSNPTLQTGEAVISRHCKCLSVKHGEPKLQCVNCQRFFHYKCIKLDSTDARSILVDDGYICHQCKNSQA